MIVWQLFWLAWWFWSWLFVIIWSWLFYNYLWLFDLFELCFFFNNVCWHASANGFRTARPEFTGGALVLQLMLLQQPLHSTLEIHVEGRLVKYSEIGYSGFEVIARVGTVQLITLIGGWLKEVLWWAKRYMRCDLCDQRASKSWSTF